MITLRDFQQQIITDLRSRYAVGKRAPLLVSPTGSGKTVMFSHIAYNASARGRKTLILVHRKELLRQTSRTLESFGVQHGSIARGMTLSQENVQIASVQTLIRRMHRMSWRPDLIVVDEAHHATGKTTWGKILHHFRAGPFDNSKTYVLGVTATAERLDGQGLGVEAGGFFDCLVLGPSPKQLINKRYLSPPVVYAPSTVDLTGIKSRGGDYAKEELAEAMDKPTITGDSVSHYKRLSMNEPAIAFCASVAHAQHVSASFQRAGISSATLDGTLDDITRAKMIEDLGNGTLKVLTSCEIVSEGFDLPVVSVGILLRPTQSMGLYLQQVGRALRPHDGKERALILDHAGNCLRHGLPDDDRRWTLEGRKRCKKDTEAAIPIKQCEQCYYVHKPAPRCPKCGFVYEVQSREIEEVEGELTQVLNTWSREDEQKRRTKREQGMAKSLDDLIRLGRQRGYKKPEKWAQNILRYRRRKAAA